MSITEKNITENLIEAHKNSRKHLLRLLEGINEDMWFEMPENGRWSLQRAASHIINAEIMWMSKTSGEEPNYLGRETSLASFKLRQDKVAHIFRERLTKEGEAGLVWIKPSEGKPSYHWDMVRCLQHAIYHTGMISLTRQIIGAPKLDKTHDTWPDMVDSIFEACIT